ncbi:dermonecrotic toxin domain-containing protein [Pseudomonas fragi]|uniref:dermonecrotic toxin domain-containing protein n=1 Tax=Pseudomonas fragi TaxID=296 RepID=UPI00113FDB3C|nr:DUF6543 domain-containing protein [Pseudomonas fragi]
MTIDLLEPGDWIAAMQEGYLANVARLDAAGQLTGEELASLQQVAALQPLYVYALELGADNGPLADLAGHFMVTQADNNQRDAFLYSPLTGLERIANSTVLRTTLKRRLADPLARDTLLRFMPIEVRGSLRSVRSLRMRRVLIDARVFDHRRRSVLDLRLHNLELLQARLLGLPSLRDVLNAQLAVALEQQFQGLGLSAQTLRVNSYAMTAADDQPALSSMSLADLALKFLAKGAWPGNQMREYLSPTVAFDALQARSPTLDVQMYRLVRETAGGIKDLLLQQLEAWWYLDIHGLSLRVLAVEIMADRFFNELLQARHEGRIGPSLFDELMDAGRLRREDDRHPRGQWRATRLSLLGQGAVRVDLAGLFGLSASATRAELFLFSARSGLEHFDNEEAFKRQVLARLKDPRSNESLLAHVARDQQPVLRHMMDTVIGVEIIEGDLFESRVRSIIDKQRRDISFLLGAVRGTDYDVNAVVEHGLDVRTLLDPRFDKMSQQGRWSTRLALDGPASGTGAAGGSATLRLTQSKLQVLNGQVALLQLGRPGLRDFARRRLKQQLALLGLSHLLPRDLVLRIYATATLRKQLEPLRVVPLVDALLERVTGWSPLPGDGARIRLGILKNSPDIKPVSSPDGALVLTLLDRAALGIVADYRQQLRQFYDTGHATLAGSSVINRMARFRGTALRYEASVKQLDGRLDSTASAIVHVVLEHTAYQERRALNGFIPDVCELALTLPDRQPSITLRDCYVITGRGGTDSENSGSALLWTASKGLESFDSLGLCLEALRARWLNRDEQGHLLRCISLRERARVLGAVEVKWTASVIETPWLEACQRRQADRHLSDIGWLLERGVAQQASAAQLVNQVACYWSEQAPFHVDTTLDDARQWMFREQLPDWLKQAAVTDQQAYAQTLLRYRQAGSEPYSQGVPELLDYARERLAGRLNADFPGSAPAPDQIEITVVQYAGPAGAEIAGGAAVSRLSRSLTYFALSNFFAVPTGVRSYRSLSDEPLPAGLDDHYVRELVRSLDLAQGYQALLVEQLAAGHEGVARRQALFSQQLPAQVLEYALQARLKGVLSQTAHDYVEHVFNSPDATARKRFRGIELVIRPLAFRAVADRHPDAALGMYLIGPVALDSAPQVLYRLYSKGPMLREYAGQGDFLHQLHGSEPLQDEVLERLESRVRKIYDYGGFHEPHVGYVDPTLSSPLEANPPATLDTAQLRGNCLGQLYIDTLNVRLALARTRAHSAAQADWASLTYLLSLLADTALLVLPGRLSVPLMVWQAEASTLAAVQAVADDRWGQALFDFANALLMLASSHATWARTAQEPHGVAAFETPMGTLSREQQASLRPYAANQVSLSDLQEDTATGLYTETSSGRRFIALDGQVFEVVAWQERWRIHIGEGLDGPLVKRNDEHRWTLDLKEPLQGGGQALGTRSGTSVALSFGRGQTVTALGMPAIERLHPRKALVIREAHEQAVRYLTDCKEHLQSVSTASELNARTQRFLARVFSVTQIEDALLDRLKRIVDKLLTALQSAEFSPLNSRRYGLYSPPNPREVARVTALGSVVKRKAVLFAQGYFASADEMFSLSVAGLDGHEFDRVKHSTATILIHEFSHLVLGTIDINYLGVSHPFEELLVPEAAWDGQIRTLKRQMQDHRYRQLSTDMRKEDLFKEKYSNRRSYLPLTFKLAHTLIQKTGSKNIDEVRERFFSEPAFRQRVILMNADSQALLITWLGYFKPATGTAV